MTKTKYNPYEEITNQVVQAMKDHGNDWTMPWKQNVKNGITHKSSCPSYERAWNKLALPVATKRQERFA